MPRHVAFSGLDHDRALTIAAGEWSLKTSLFLFCFRTQVNPFTALPRPPATDV